MTDTPDTRRRNRLKYLIALVGFLASAVLLGISAARDGSAAEWVAAAVALAAALFTLNARRKM